MLQFNVFPDGKRKIVTFSYDDGPQADARLVELFNKYGVKATFHLNSAKYRGMTDEQLAEFAALYKGHEISTHTVHHGFPVLMPTSSLINEALEDRRLLEKIAEYPVIGMSYPYGNYDDRVIDVFKSVGIVYSRTVRSHGNFNLPADFMQWHPTCHHGGALALCEKFLEESRYSDRALFYIWGHSYEFDNANNWDLMEKILEQISGKDDIWYATNIEIYNYIKAQRSLVISVDESYIYNPSAIDVWVEKDKKDLICIPAGKTVTV